MQSIKDWLEATAFIFLLCLVVIIMLTTTAHCEPTSIRSEALGINQPYENPNTYLLASISKGKVLEDDNGTLSTNIVFQPYNTYGLFTQSVRFCGDVSESFNSKRGALIVTYETVAHRRTQGVGCHELISVFRVKESDGK
jgi:hypothetical protein